MDSNWNMCDEYGKEAVTQRDSYIVDQPLCLQHKLYPRRKRSLLGCLIKMLWSYCTYGPAYNSIKNQLLKRSLNYNRLWEQLDILPIIRVEICEIIKAHMGWPNSRFLPDDPLDMVLMLSWHEMDYNLIFMDIEKKYSIDLILFETTDLSSIKLGEFITHICSLISKNNQ